MPKLRLDFTLLTLGIIPRKPYSIIRGIPQHQLNLLLLINNTVPKLRLVLKIIRQPFKHYRFLIPFPNNSYLLALIRIQYCQHLDLPGKLSYLMRCKLDVKSMISLGCQSKHRLIKESKLFVRSEDKFSGRGNCPITLCYKDFFNGFAYVGLWEF